MPKTPAVEAAPESPDDLTDDSSAYEVPPELDETALDDGGGEEPPARAPRSATLRLAAVVAVVLVVGGSLLVYRAHHRRKVLAEGLSKADALLRLDTAAGYREAASLLEPLATLDPGDAASVRAFALAMLYADYRATGADAEAEALLVGPGRADVVPVHAHLASAALALGRREVGTATTSAARAGEGPWARTLEARIALLAGNVPAALEPAASAAAEGAFPPGLAVHGDALRRLRRDPAGARAAYEAALSTSPLQPRAAYGLAKLALAGQAPPERAITALERLLEDRAGTPDVERARAALHLAALPDTDYCLSAGGDITCHTHDPSAAPWRIGIENPHDPTRIVAVFPLHSGAVATSGTARRGAHITDARTGRPAADLASV
ncbi:MAG TPA: FAD:protein FMN transferase, partial [Anaeromyxobacter sp.]